MSIHPVKGFIKSYEDKTSQRNLALRRHFNEEMQAIKHPSMTTLGGKLQNIMVLYKTMVFHGDTNTEAGQASFLNYIRHLRRKLQEVDQELAAIEDKYA